MLHQFPVHHPPRQILHTALVGEQQLRLGIKLPYSDGERILLRQLVEIMKFGGEVVFHRRERLRLHEVVLSRGIRRRVIQANIQQVVARLGARLAVHRGGGIEIVGVLIRGGQFGPPGEAEVVLRRRRVRRGEGSVGGGSG